LERGWIEMQAFTHDAVHCWILPSDVISDNGLTSAMIVLTKTERERAASFYFDRHRRLYLASHTALRLLIASYTGHPPESLPIILNAMGRPVLEGRELSRLRFSLSHSGDMAVVALAADEAVGVDVEQVRDFPDLMEIAQCYFTLSEASAIRRLQPLQRPAAFAVTWTRKEAVVKALGLGLNMALDSFDTGPADAPACATTDGVRWVNWTLLDLLPGAGYVGAVATRRANASLIVQKFSWTGAIGCSGAFR
jgi:4'-phosphopantetheinyl transferase